MVIDTFTIAGRFSSLPFTESTAWLVSIAGRPRCCLVGSIYMQIPTIKRRNEGVDGAFVHTRKWVIRTTRYRDEFARDEFNDPIWSDPITPTRNGTARQFFKTERSYLWNFRITLDFILCFLLLLLLLFIDDYPRKKFVDLFHRRVRSTNKNGK